MTYAVKMLAPQKFAAPPNIIRIMNRTKNVIRLHWWSKDTYGSNRQRTENIDPQQYIALPAQDGVQWTLSEEDYSTFCWITGMRGSVPLNNFSFQAREPFDIKIVADDSVFSNKAQYIYMVVDDDATTQTVDNVPTEATAPAPSTAPSTAPAPAPSTAPAPAPSTAPAPAPAPSPWSDLTPGISTISDSTWDMWDVMVAQALKNYENSHNLPTGSATHYDLDHSSSCVDGGVDGGSEPFRFDAAKYPGIDRNSPAMQRCRDALLAAILDEDVHR